MNATTPSHLADVRGLERLIALADAIARQSGTAHEFEWLARELSTALGTRVAVFESSRHGWMLAAQYGGRIRASLRDLERALSGLATAAVVAAVDLRGGGEDVWTAMRVAHPTGSSMQILLAGNWTHVAEQLTWFSLIVSSTFRFGDAQSGRARADRLLRHGYQFGRRLSRLDGLGAVCQDVVDQLSNALNAGRVALALHRPDENRLAVAATVGYPMSTVTDVRIEPGSWVMGHVYQTRRPILVRDLTRLERAPILQRDYRTASFVAAPMLAGKTSIGVLSATDKRDNSAFDEHDAATLRTLAVPAALAVMAAQSSEEATKLTYAAAADTLTGLFNRSYLDKRLHQELERARRTTSTLAVLLLDVDDFKKINDTYGHQVGDSILRSVGDILRSSVRIFDVCARFGGDEFAILMPGADGERAVASAERMRLRVASYEGFQHGIRLTVSIGVTVVRDGDRPDDPVRRADQFLYQAKFDGKNRVCGRGEAPAAIGRGVERGEFKP